MQRAKDDEQKAPNARATQTFLLWTAHSAAANSFSALVHMRAYNHCVERHPGIITPKERAAAVFWLPGISALVLKCLRAGAI